MKNPIIKKIDCEELEKEEKLLVVSEQGLGDTLQYMRYIPYLRNKGINISFCAQEKLHTLIKASKINENPLTEAQANIVSEGKWIPLLSIPRYLKVNPKNPITTQKYIYSTDELITKWKNILAKEKKPIVGINWQGNKKLETTYQGRSIPLEIFSKITSQNGVLKLFSGGNLYSLFKGSMASNGKSFNACLVPIFELFFSGNSKKRLLYLSDNNPTKKTLSLFCGKP